MVTGTQEPPAEGPPAPAPSAAPAPKPATTSGAKKPGAYGDWQVNALHPPFDVEPHEVPADGSRPDLFQILLSRQEKKEKKAESRRESRRRKAERLRA